MVSHCAGLFKSLICLYWELHFLESSFLYGFLLEFPKSKVTWDSGGGSEAIGITLYSFLWLEVGKAICRSAGVFQFVLFLPDIGPILCTVALICIAVITKEVEHIFTCLLVICIFSSYKVFNSLVYFFHWLHRFVFFNCKNS